MCVLKRRRKGREKGKEGEEGYNWNNIVTKLSERRKKRVRVSFPRRKREKRRGLAEEEGERRNI